MVEFAHIMARLQRPYRPEPSLAGGIFSKLIRKPQSSFDLRRADIGANFVRAAPSLSTDAVWVREVIAQDVTRSPEFVTSLDFFRPFSSAFHLDKNQEAK